MTSGWTLPLIGSELDTLPGGCDFIVSGGDAARLFGGVTAERRIFAFAAAHGCSAVPRDGELIFRRLADAPPGPADAVDCFPACAPRSPDSGDDHPGCGTR